MIHNFKNTLYGGSLGAVTGLGISALIYSNAFTILIFLSLGLIMGYIHP